MSSTTSTRLLAVLGTLLIAPAIPRAVAAQSVASRASAWEFRITGGAFVPTGGQRELLGTAHATAAQLAWLPSPSLAVTGTLGWARSRDLSGAGTPKLDLFSADAGVEYRPSAWFSGRKVTFSPFVGAGAGGRRYDSRARGVATDQHMAAYGAVGGEIGAGRFGLRLELRDYATRFAPSGGATLRNDMMVFIGLRFNRHAVARQ